MANHTNVIQLTRRLLIATDAALVKVINELIAAIKELKNEVQANVSWIFLQ